MRTQKVIRVLQIPGKMDYGGVSAVLMNYYRHIDKSKVQFDFAVNIDCAFPQQNELIAGGSKLYRVSSLKNVLRYIHDVYKIIKTEKYQIVHAHMNSLNIFPLLAAKLAGAQIRICHNHSTDAEGEFIRNTAKNIFKMFSRIFPTHYAACSEYAANWLYGKRFCKRHPVKIIHNGIELGRFAYNAEVRDEVRRRYGMGEKFVIGNIGRFVFQKNHDLLIDIYNAIYRENRDTVLLLVGEGELLEEVKTKVRKYGLENAVIFTGVEKDTSKLYQAMDVFVLTSRYEGLSVTTVEAQVNGLHCVVSGAVPEEAIISGNVERVEDYSNIKEWTKKIMDKKNRVLGKSEAIKLYDIISCAQELEKYYGDLV
ncbi:MAG: glycosyltransferase [Blautia sp.]|nr:glycosyltransferase [Blautia sp.]